MGSLTSNLGRQSLFLPGNLPDEKNFAMAGCSPDLAALLAESRRFRHQIIRHHNIGPKQRRQQSCVITKRPLAAPQAYTAPRKFTPCGLTMYVVETCRMTYTVLGHPINHTPPPSSVAQRAHSTDRLADSEQPVP